MGIRSWRASNEHPIMPLDTFYHLYRLAEAGATIVIHKTLPGDVPGLGKLLGRRSEFQVHKEAFNRGTKGADGITTLSWNKGRLLLGDDLEKLLERAGVRRETLVDRGLQFERRAHDGLPHPAADPDHDDAERRGRVRHEDLLSNRASASLIRCESASPQGTSGPRTDADIIPATIASSTAAQTV